MLNNCKDCNSAEIHMPSGKTHTCLEKGKISVKKLKYKVKREKTQI